MSCTHFQSLGITRRWTAVFVPNNAATLVTLRTVEPFVFYGPLNAHLTRELFTKRLRLRSIPRKTGGDSAAAETAVADEDDDEIGDATQRNEAIASVDNALIEERLGHLGILCLDDLIEEVQAGGPSFQEIMSHVYPFQLQDLCKVDGVDAAILEFGHIGFRINQKIEKVI